MASENSHILMIEDEENIALGLRLHLEKQNYTVSWAKDGEQGVQFWKDLNPDLIILDIMLPKKDGLEVLQEIRSQTLRLPILILSAKDSTYDKVKALKRGVDDYLSKPFDAQELLLRIERLLVKKQWYADEQVDNDTDQMPEAYEFKGNRIDFSLSKAFTSKGESIQLTDQELRLLRVFVNHPEKAHSRKDLLKMAWGYQEEIETRTLDNFIVRFRRYFELNPKKPQHFKSLRSVGYLFSPE